MIAHAQEILKRADAPKQIEALNAALEDEKRRRQEFREWVTEDVKAEFINGEVVIHSPVRRRHWDASDFLQSLLSPFVKIKKLGRVGVEKVMVALTRNDYEPDICFFSREKYAEFDADQVLFPAPDFVVEILSKKTAKNDRVTKKGDYAAHGVREYWIVDPVKKEVEQFVLVSEGDSEYFPAYVYRIDDDIESRVVSGFKIPVRAIFEEAANVEAMTKLFAEAVRS